jgi:hypothetical protein
MNAGFIIGILVENNQLKAREVKAKIQEPSFRSQEPQQNKPKTMFFIFFKTTGIVNSIPKEEYEKTFQKWLERKEWNYVYKIMETILNI